MSFIAEHIDPNRFDSQLLVIESAENKSYEISKIPVTFLNKKRVRDGFFQIISFLRSNDIKIAVSAIGHVNTLMAFVAFFLPKIKFVGRETIVKTALLKVKNKPIKRSFVSSLLSKIQIRNLDVLICQSDDMRNDLVKNFNYPIEKLVVLNNPITKGFHIKSKEESNAVIQLITIGRLVPQKGHLRILKVLTKFDIPYHYTIIGSGELKESLFQYVDKNGLKDNITHIPFTKDVQSYLEKSDLYLQGSFVEGFPNALLETCTVGTPVLAFDAPGGINEIIIDGVNGYIAVDEDDFLLKLYKCVKTEWSASKINESVTGRYSEEIILKKYEEFFLQLNDSKIHA